MDKNTKDSKVWVQCAICRGKFAWLQLVKVVSSDTVTITDKAVCNMCLATPQSEFLGGVWVCRV